MSWLDGLARAVCVAAWVLFLTTLVAVVILTLAG
jgi:hypothetical protein